MLLRYQTLFWLFSYNIGVFDKDPSEGQFSGYSKIERPHQSLPLANSQDSGSRKVSEESLVASPSAKKEKYNVKVDSNGNEILAYLSNFFEELQDIFSEVFQNTEVLRKIQERLTGYIAKENKEKNGDMVEYSIETDYKAITDYMVGTLTNIMNQKVNNDQVKSVNSIKEEEEKTDANKKNLLDIPLGESIYEPSVKSDPIYNSYKSRDSNNSSVRSFECKNLASTLGVRLVLQYEDGKARFVSVPISQDYSIIEKQPEAAVEPKANYEKIEEKEEDIEEPAFNVPLKVKRVVSVVTF